MERLALDYCSEDHWKLLNTLCYVNVGVMEIIKTIFKNAVIIINDKELQNKVPEHSFKWLHDVLDEILEHRNIFADLNDHQLCEEDEPPTIVQEKWLSFCIEVEAKNQKKEIFRVNEMDTSSVNTSK